CHGRPVSVVAPPRRQTMARPKEPKRSSCICRRLRGRVPQRRLSCSSQGREARLEAVRDFWTAPRNRPRGNARGEAKRVITTYLFSGLLLVPLPTAALAAATAAALAAATAAALAAATAAALAAATAAALAAATAAALAAA